MPTYEVQRTIIERLTVKECSEKCARLVASQRVEEAWETVHRAVTVRECSSDGPVLTCLGAVLEERLCDFRLNVQQRAAIMESALGSLDLEMGEQVTLPDDTVLTVTGKEKLVINE